MKYIYDGHEYSYNDSARTVKNNYGEIVATWDDDLTGEYYYPTITEWDDDDDRQPPAIHVNVIQDNENARGLWLVQTYVAATS